MDAYSISLKIIVLMWQFGLVDTFTAVQFFYNAGAQYAAIVLGSITDSNATNILPMLVEPISGLHVGYRFIKAAGTPAERHSRIATLAALLSASAAVAANSNPGANAAMGGTVMAHIGDMRKSLEVPGGQIIGDSRVSLSTVSKIDSYRLEFTNKSKIIIENMFEDFKTSQSLYATRYVLPAAGKTLLTTKISTILFLGQASLGVGIFAFSIYGVLCIFQWAERKRFYLNNSNSKISNC